MGGGVWVTEVFDPYFAEIESRSEGRIKIEAHWGGELVNIMDAYDAAAGGTVDLAHFLPPMIAGRFPMDEVMTFGQYTNHCWKSSRVYHELFNEFPDMRAPYNDTKIITQYVLYQRGLGNTKRPIYKLEDFAGLKLLSSGRWAGARIEALGATPVSISPEEMFSSIQNGVIDGSWAVGFALVDWGFGELFKYISDMSTPQAIMDITMNLNTWNSLPADLQQIMADTGEWFVDYCDEAQLRVQNERIQAAKEQYDIQWNDIPQEEYERWVPADRAVLDEYATELEEKGYPGYNLRDEFLKLEKKYSGMEYAPDWAK